MATLDLTAETFNETIAENDIVFIDFWAEWCGPCRVFAPVYESVSEQHDDILFAKVDTEAEPALAGEFGIRSIPTLAILREGILLFSQPGALPEAALEDLIGQVRDLDMDEVRRAVEDEAGDTSVA